MQKKHRIQRFIFFLVVVLCLPACVRNLPGKTVEPTSTVTDNVTEKDDGNVFTDTLPVEGTAVAPEGGTPIPEGTTFEDPWQYCNAVGTINSYGKEYTGTPSPTVIRELVLEMLNIPEDERASHNVIWRCASGQVLGCDASAYQTCLNVYDLNMTPSAIIEEECRKAEMEGVTLPQAVTGSQTPYEWRCIGGVPKITGQGIPVDEQGLNPSIWFPIPKP